MATDRKAASRAYREERRPVGIFRVRLAPGGYAYLSSSVDLPSMANRQRFQLEMGSHPDKTLQAEFNRIGSEGYEFEVLDTLELPDDLAYNPRDDLRELLDMWRERLAAEAGAGNAPVAEGDEDA
ncbi:MAG: GIY-YIG nuclease family protein [Coriobacteriia bacterium]|nr:GIY-YIG nuclease family protein [Coriobacteriia bacterium]